MSQGVIVVVVLCKCAVSRAEVGFMVIISVTGKDKLYVAGTNHLHIIKADMKSFPIM